jgi:hypothetical protein
MYLIKVCMAVAVALTCGSCASQPSADACEADVSPEGYDLVLRTVPGARVDYRIGKTTKSLKTASGVEKIGTSADEVEVLRCVRDDSTT